MPSRQLRDGFRTSKRMSRIGFNARLTFVMLLTVVDDYGCYEGEHEMLIKVLYPYENVGEGEFGRWMGELYDARVILPYEKDGFKYVWMPRLRERIRAARKFPEPPFEEATDRHLFATCPSFKTWIDKHCPSIARQLSDNCPPSCGQLPASTKAQARRGEAHDLILRGDARGENGPLLDSVESQISESANEAAVISQAIEIFTGKSAPNQGGTERRIFTEIARRVLPADKPIGAEFVELVRNAKDLGHSTVEGMRSFLYKHDWSKVEKPKNEREQLGRHHGRGADYYAGKPKGAADAALSGAAPKTGKIPNNGRHEPPANGPDDSRGGVPF